MSTPSHPRRTALVVIDMQNAVVANAWHRGQVIAAIQGLVSKARGQGAPVVWVRHENAELVPGHPEWQIVAELTPAPDEPVIGKIYNDAFAGTALETLLAERHVSAVVVCGAQSDACVRATLYGALHRGFDTCLAADAHTTEDMTAYGAPEPGLVVAHLNLTWAFNRLPGRTATAKNLADIHF